MWWPPPVGPPGSASRSAGPGPPPVQHVTHHNRQYYNDQGRGPPHPGLRPGPPPVPGHKGGALPSANHTTQHFDPMAMAQHHRHPSLAPQLGTWNVPVRPHQPLTLPTPPATGRPPKHVFAPYSGRRRAAAAAMPPSQPGLRPPALLAHVPARGQGPTAGREVSTMAEQRPQPGCLRPERTQRPSAESAATPKVGVICSGPGPVAYLVSSLPFRVNCRTWTLLLLECSKAMVWA